MGARSLPSHACPYKDSTPSHIGAPNRRKSAQASYLFTKPMLLNYGPTLDNNSKLISSDDVLMTPYPSVTIPEPDKLNNITPYNVRKPCLTAKLE